MCWQKCGTMHVNCLTPLCRGGWPIKGQTATCTAEAAVGEQARHRRLRQAGGSGTYQYLLDAVEQAELGMQEARTGGCGGGGAGAATAGNHKSPAACETAAQQPPCRAGKRRPRRRPTRSPCRRPERRRPLRRADHGAPTAPGHLPSLTLSQSAATDGRRTTRTNCSLQKVRERTVKTYLERALPQLERKASRHLVRQQASPQQADDAAGEVADVDRHVRPEFT